MKILFAGEAKEELVLYKPEGCKQDFIIMVPTNDSWGECIEQCYKDKAKKVCRYAAKKESNILGVAILKDGEVVSGASSYSWDAQNKWSLALAEKLGYHFSHEYVAYNVSYND